MSRWTSLSIHSLAIAALVTLGGCELSTQGAEGNMSFSDRTTGAVSLDDNLGVGATVAVVVHCTGCAETANLAASSADSGVAEVTSAGIDTIYVRGMAPGATEIMVTKGDVSDRFVIQVAEVVDADIRMLPWADLLPLPGALWADGYAMFDGDSVAIRAFPRDANGDRTTGVGAVEWTTDAGATIDVDPERRDDTITATAASDTFVVMPSVGEPQTVEVVTLEDVASATVVTSDGDLFAEGDTLEIELGDAVILHLAAFTGSGAYIAGNGGQFADHELSASLDGLLESRLEDLADGAPEVRDLFPRGFMFAAEQTTGTGSLTLSWAGQSVTLNVEIVAPEAQE